MNLTKPRIEVTEDDLREALFDALLRTGVRSLDADEARALADELVEAAREVPAREH